MSRINGIEEFNSIEAPPYSNHYSDLNYQDHKEEWESSALGVTEYDTCMSGDIEEYMQELSNSLKKIGGDNTKVGVFIRWIEECPTTLMEG